MNAIANETDVIMCYRLLLGRDPDPTGLVHFQTVIKEGRCTVDQLVELFLSSAEYHSRRQDQQLAQDALEILDLARFRMKIAPGWNAIHREIKLTNEYEPHVAQQIEDHIRPGSIFIDVGANCGFHSLLAASLGAKVHAFEPNARNIWFIQQNIALNEFIIDIHPYAVGASKSLVVYNPGDGNGSIYPFDSAILPSPDQQVMLTEPLDHYFGTMKVDLIKMDIEGAEGLAIRGASQLLEQRPTILFEYSPAALEHISGISGANFLETLV